ncbi:MAG: type II secretion system protein GspD, partial [Sulfuriferula sp.]
MKHYWLQMGTLCMGILLPAGLAWSVDESAPPAVLATVEKPQHTNYPTAADAVTLNFVNADIEGVVKVVSDITGKNFLLDPKVKGTINIVSAKPIPRAAVYDAFLSALRLHGFAVIEDKGLVKIIPEADAKLNTSPTFGTAEQ